MLGGALARESALLDVVRNERQRWHELRMYAIGRADEALMDAMNAASGRYAERSRSGQDDLPVLD